MNGVLVLGAGGHGKVVADILLSGGLAVLGFVDDDDRLAGARVLGLPVLGRIDDYAACRPAGIVLGIGANAVRKQLVDRLGAAAEPLWITAAHPRATLAASVVAGPGTVVVAGAVVNVDAVIGAHAIINTCASVDHDCRVGDYAHIAPGARLAGAVSIGEGAFIGAGAAILPGRSVGCWATVGAGAVVARDVPDGVVAKGLPARWQQ
jgi:sugar O-acyltransferase (sialic acid O-acetyltransferase NeuD family)